MGAQGVRDDDRRVRPAKGRPTKSIAGPVRSSLCPLGTLEMTQKQLRHLGAWGRDARNERRAPSRVIWGLAALDPGSLRSTPATLVGKQGSYF